MTPAQQRGYEVGDRFEVIDGCGYFNAGTIVYLTYDDSSDCPKFCVEANVETPLTGAGYAAFLGLDYVRKLYTAVSPTTLPERFQLNPSGNESLSKAMQERLFELGYIWYRTRHKGANHLTAPYLVGCSPEPDNDYFHITHTSGEVLGNPPLLTLDDLYRLQPAPKTPPKLEIAGRTLELKDGRVVGTEFDCEVSEFIGTLQAALNDRGFGNKMVRAVSIRVGCQIIDRDSAIRAINWAKEVSE